MIMHHTFFSDINVSSCWSYTFHSEHTRLTCMWQTCSCIWDWQKVKENISKNKLHKKYANHEFHLWITDTTWSRMKIHKAMKIQRKLLWETRSTNFCTATDVSIYWLTLGQVRVQFIMVWQRYTENGSLSIPSLSSVASSRESMIQR
jgi:hypothetical protein